MTEHSAIETKYKGFRFRSRLEARWAVFFDALEISFQYEPEGFLLLQGQTIPYLPDFYLPDPGVWIEIKGPPPNKEEILKCQLLADQTDKPVYLYYGAIPRQGEDIEHVGVLLFNKQRTPPEEVDTEDVNWWFPWRPHNGNEAWDACDSARGARFEHGEKGAFPKLQLVDPPENGHLLSRKPEVPEIRAWAASVPWDGRLCALRIAINLGVPDPCKSWYADVIHRWCAAVLVNPQPVVLGKWRPYTTNSRLVLRGPASALERLAGFLTPKEGLPEGTLRLNPKIAVPIGEALPMTAFNGVDNWEPADTQQLWAEALHALQNESSLYQQNRYSQRPKPSRHVAHCLREMLSVGATGSEKKSVVCTEAFRVKWPEETLKHIAEGGVLRLKLRELLLELWDLDPEDEVLSRLKDSEPVEIGLYFQDDRTVTLGSEFKGNVCISLPSPFKDGRYKLRYTAPDNTRWTVERIRASSLLDHVRLAATATAHPLSKGRA